MAGMETDGSVMAFDVVFSGEERVSDTVSLALCARSRVVEGAPGYGVA